MAGLLLLDDAAFRARFRRSPLSRPSAGGLARNAAVALGNRRNPRDVAALHRALVADPEPIVREHAAWALGRFRGDHAARRALQGAREREHDGRTRAAIDHALGWQ